jgi:hypothetical protein
MPKKRTSKRPSAKKRTTNPKTSGKRPRASTRKKGSGRGKSSKAGSRRGPLSRIRVAGEKTWKVLKSTTAHMVDEVKESFGGDERARDR